MAIRGGGDFVVKYNRGPHQVPLHQSDVENITSPSYKALRQYMRTGLHPSKVLLRELRGNSAVHTVAILCVYNWK